MTVFRPRPIPRLSLSDDHGMSRFSDQKFTVAEISSASGNERTNLGDFIPLREHRFGDFRPW